MDAARILSKFFKNGPSLSFVDEVFLLLVLFSERAPDILDEFFFLSFGSFLEIVPLSASCTFILGMWLTALWAKERNVSKAVCSSWPSGVFSSA